MWQSRRYWTIAALLVIPWAMAAYAYSEGGHQLFGDVPRLLLAVSSAVTGSAFVTRRFKEPANRLIGLLAFLRFFLVLISLFAFSVAFWNFVRKAHRV